MRIQVNGAPREIEDAATVTRLLEILELDGVRVAVAINRVVVPSTRHGVVTLDEGDSVEIIHAVAGG